VATDLDERLLARAREGVFAPSSLKELPDDLRAAGFELANGARRVRERFRSIEFLREDLREAMPQGPFDLILCRNVLFTYYAPSVRQPLVERMVERLRPGGALAVGIHETIPVEVSSLQPWPRVRALYRRA
jgi:chemotaxis protein methyltransferase CheR